MPRKKKEAIEVEKNAVIEGTRSGRKSRLAKVKDKNATVDPEIEEPSTTVISDKGKPRSKNVQRAKKGNKVINSSGCNNNMDESVSEYFSSSQNSIDASSKSERLKQKENKSSYASKAKKLKNLDSSVDVSDDEFELSTINYNSPSDKRNNLAKSRKSVVNSDKTNVKDENKDNEVSKNVDSDVVKKSKTKKKRDEIEMTNEKVGKGNKTTTHRKRKVNMENDLEVKKPKVQTIKQKNCKKEKSIKNKQKEVKVACKVENEETEKKTNKDDVLNMLKHTEEAASEKGKAKAIPNESGESSDDEMMDVEEDDNLNAVPKTILPKSVDHSDAMAILMHMEGPKQSYNTEKPSTSKACVVDDTEQLSDDEDDDDEEESDWEDVADHHGNSPKKSQVPTDSVEITLDAPVIYRKKKKKGEFDIQAYFKRQINKFKREVAMDIHKVHLLCLLARCQYLNNLCMDETIQAQVFSITLVTKELKLPSVKSCTDDHVTKVLLWIKEKQHYLTDVMNGSLNEVPTQLKITLICVILLRQVGFLTRLVTSLQPVPFKETSNKSNPLKKGKSLKVSKGKGTVKTENKQSDPKSTKAKPGKKNVSKKSEKFVKTEHIKEEKQIKSEKMEVDEEIKNKGKEPKGAKLVKRRSSDRKCSKVSKNVYKDYLGRDDELLSDDNDDDYKPSDGDPDDENNIQKNKRKRIKTEKNIKIENEEKISEKLENVSDDDFEQDSILIRTQQLKKEPSKTKNRKALSSDTESENIGVDNWAEVFIEREKKWICVDCAILQVKKPYELENKATQPVCYVVGINQEGYMRDVTARYASQWLTETRKYRVDSEWWEETIGLYKCPNKTRDQLEDQELSSQLQQRPLPTSIGAFKSHPLYALKRHLLKFEALYPDTAIPVGYIRGEPVYARECVHTLHSRENWLKEGRAVRIGEEPYKFVKSRPKWNRPKEDPEAKDLELFGPWQTELYIPPPAVDGKVPRNAHGNVEMFLPSMLPAGTVHLKVPALNKVAKKLDIDCAPAMVGWDHHCGFSHPLMDGWIVCEEHKDILLAAWDEEQEIIREKEQQKREKRVYENWRKLIRGMLIKERLKKRFDLEEKPGEDSRKCVKASESEGVQTTETTTKAMEKATDQKHAWPQNRMINKQHTLCVVEEL